MESFSHYLKRNAQETEACMQLGANDIFKLEIYATGLGRVVLNTEKYDKLSSTTKAVLELFKDKTFLEKIKLLTMSEIVGKGPKVFRPTAYQLFMLEKMNLNIEINDFNAPFTDMVFELPDEYVQKRKPHNQKLLFSTLRFHKEAKFFVHNVVYEDCAYTAWAHLEDGKEIEAWFINHENDNVIVDSLPVNAQEKACEHLIRRAVLNYCLLLDEVGIKKQGPESPNEYAQLVKWCQKENKHTARNKLQLQAQPILYGLAKNPTELVRVLDSTNDTMQHGIYEANPKGKVSPHSRRGHYRHYRHEDGTVKLRVRIPPCVINKHLLLEPPSKVYAT